MESPFPLQKLSVEQLYSAEKLKPLRVAVLLQSPVGEAVSKDAVDAGYETRVLIDLTAPVHENKLDEVIAKMEDEGITVKQAL